MKNTLTSTDLKSIFSNLLKDLRKNAGLTQLQVADALGYSTAQFISNWERGVSIPPVSSFQTLAELYKVSPDTFSSLAEELTRLRMFKRGPTSSKEYLDDGNEPVALLEVSPEKKAS